MFFSISIFSVNHFRKNNNNVNTCYISIYIYCKTIISFISDEKFSPDEKPKIISVHLLCFLDLTIFWI